MKTNRFRVITTTGDILCEGTKAKCSGYLTGLKVESPNVAPECSIVNYDDETGKWTKVAA